MDEIDSIGSSRIESGSGGDSEVQRTMLELLNQLDGFEATKNIKVLILMRTYFQNRQGILYQGLSCWTGYYGYEPYRHLGPGPAATWPYRS